MSYPTPLVPNTIDIALQGVTLAMLGLPANAYSAVRVGWQDQGQPSWAITDDVCVIRAVEEDSEYSRVRDVTTLSNDSQSVIQLTTYTRVWRVFFSIYGPNSFDHVRILRSALFQQASHDTLSLLNLYFVPDPSAPRRVPEIKDKQWWERVDFDILLNEAVFEVPIAPSIASAEVIVETNNGIVADIKYP